MEELQVSDKPFVRTDEEFESAPVGRAEQDELLLTVTLDSLFDLLRERRTLREALTAAQERCSKLNDENREQRVEYEKLKATLDLVANRLAMEDGK